MHATIEDILNKRVGDIATEDIRTADVFKAFGIDFCCRGNQLLGEVCREQHLDPQQVILSLTNAMSDVKGPIHDYKNWSVPFLIDFIANTHHPYVRSSIPVLLRLGEKVCHAHGHLHPETRKILHLLKTLELDLVQHLREEEEEDFPILLQVAQGGDTLDHPLTRRAEQVLQKLVDDHLAVGELILKIDALSHHFTPPEDACNTYRIYYKKLSEFRDDLFNHIHLENNVLFDKVSSHLEGPCDGTSTL